VHYLCGVAHVANKTTEKKKKKTPSDGNCSTMLICVRIFYLCIHQQNHSLNGFDEFWQSPKYDTFSLYDV
jgi:hypothetical protein